MPLTGEAKTTYQREYMRRKRSGLTGSNGGGLAGEPQSTAGAAPTSREAELEARIRELEFEVFCEQRARRIAEAKAESATPKPRRSKMTKKTRTAIVMALHPDHAAHSTVESREEALKLFLQLFLRENV
jgi:hypothetical protein